MLKLEYKKISTQTSNAMKKAVDSNKDYYNEAVDTIKELLPSNEIHILNSANSAIFTIVEALPEPIIIPDEGGWNGLQRSAKILNKKTMEITTEDGLINLKELDDYFNKNDVGSLYITSLVGYTKEQPLKEIFELCNLHEVILIVDISGSIGDDMLSNTKYADIQVSSTGSPKIVNVENGGFINNITQKIKFNNHLLKTFKVDNITCAGIIEEIPNAKINLEKTINATQYLKNKLIQELESDEKHEIIHKDGRGINIIISEESKSKAKQLSFKIREKIEISNNKSIITTGPNYNRLKRPCVCIELKNLDINSLSKENLDKLNDIIITAINE
ncbi:DegT/DnrJ/EryC1/StrS family aminotransferase [Methanosphaera sp.]